MFPNPTRSEITVLFSEELQLKEIKVFNNLGQIISKYTSENFNTDYLAAGLYYLQIETDKGVFTKSLIKE